MAVMYAHLSVPPPTLTSLRPELPPEVDEIMQRALAKAPEDRYPSCGEFADALRIALGLRRYDSDPAIAPQPQASADQAAPLAVAHASVTGIQAARGSDQAIELYQQTLAGQRHTLGPDHPDTLGTRFSLAREMAACGDHARAEEEFRAVFAARVRKLGPDHHDTLIARFNIAQQMAERGNHAGAEEEFRGLLTGLRRRLGPNHPDTLATWFSIAQQQAARGDDAGAEKEFRYMLPHLRSRLGPDHPNSRAATEWIKYIQGKTGVPSPVPRPRS